MITYCFSSYLYNLLDSLKITNINANNIPSELKGKIFIFNAGNIKQLKSKKEKCKKIISKLCDKTNKLECYADEKHLMIGKLKYPKMFSHGGTIGFMELYITMIINRKLKHVK